MPISPALMLSLFAATLFLSATLLFLVQPMIGKMILPQLGGTPAVWNTCMVFFQAVLLLGYAYAHASTTWLSGRARIVLHCIVLFIPVIVFPISVSETWAPRGDANPVPAVLGLLFLSAGLPFFVVSTSAPLLQKWFAGTGHPAAKDPYFLYGASNLGSMLALVIYPVLVEPSLEVAYQSIAWAVGYGLLVVLTLVCAYLVWQSAPAPAPSFAGGESAGRTPVLETGAKGSTDITKSKPSKGVKKGRLDPLDRPDRPLLEHEEKVTPWQRLHWIALAFVPSSLMLGATTYITTDVAAIPFLWVLPLGLYLLSFILVFSKLSPMQDKLLVVISHSVFALFLFLTYGVPWFLSRRGVAWTPNLWELLVGIGVGLGAILWFGRGWIRAAPPLLSKTMAIELPLLVLLLAFIMMSNLGRLPMTAKIGLHLVVLFVAAMVCHGELARRRPSTRHLTEFYLLMSLGGVLGGVFNALVAPVVFNGIYEYPIAMMLACLMLPRSPNEEKGLVARSLDFALPAGLLLLSVILMSGLLGIRLNLARLADFYTEVPARLATFLEDRAGQIEGSFLKIIRYGLPVVICYIFVDRPLRLALGVGAVMLAFGMVERMGEDVMHQERSFFGVLKVERDGKNHRLVHGTTLHGTQRTDWDNRYRFFTLRNFLPAMSATTPLEAAAFLYMANDNWLEPPREALTYYHRTGPIGQVVREFRHEDLYGRTNHIAVIGLGTGTMASYGEPGKKITFYDIDKTVKEIAENPKYFTFLSDAKKRNAEVDIVLGDARVRLKEAITDKPEEKYGIMVIDAFSSDAIPVHLITKQALEIYLKKLDEHGIIAFHISNRHLDLEPVLGNLAQAVDPKLVGYVQHDHKDEDVFPGKAASTWVILARDRSDFGSLPEQKDSEGKLRWEPLKGNPKAGVWTDGFSNVLGVFNWK